MKTSFAIFAILLISGLYAQQDPQYTQYMYNTINVNPAYAGSRGVMSIFALHRTQWAGLDGAPVTNTISVNTPVAQRGIGLGLSVVNDRIGISDENNIAIDLSYSIKASATYKLSFGIKAGANLLSVDFSRLTLMPGDSPIVSDDNIKNQFKPTMGAGMYLHSEDSYAGLSIPNFLETNYYQHSTTSVASEKMHWFLIMGHVFEISSSMRLKPALLTKISSGAPLQIDLSANVLVHDKFSAGAAYRSSAAWSLMAGFQIDHSWYIGYAYDTENTKLANYNSGSHELFLRYELFSVTDKIVSPRFF